MKVLQMHVHVLLYALVLFLFKTSHADPRCSYFYNVIPPQTIDCDPKGKSIKLLYIVRVSHDYPTSVKWFWNQAEPAASPGINEAINASDKYILESIIESSANQDGLFGDVHTLNITNVTLPADSGYYWCQIVVNGTVLLQPPPPSLINSSSLECPRDMDFFYDLEPDQCATNEVEQIQSSNVTLVITHTYSTISSLQLQLSTKLTTMTPSTVATQGTPGATDPSPNDMKSLAIAVAVCALIACIFSIITCSLCLYIYCSKKRMKKKAPTADLTDNNRIHNAESAQLELQDYITSPVGNTENEKAANNLSDQDGLYGAVSTQLELQDYTAMKSTDNIEAEYDPQSVPDFVDERPSIYDDEENSTQRQTQNYYSEAGPSARHTSACPTGTTTTVDGKASADVNLCSYNNQMKECNITLDTVKEEDTQKDKQHKLRKTTVEFTTHAASEAGKEYALPFIRSSDVHVYDDIKGESERRPGLTEPEPHYYSVIRDKPSENPSPSPRSPLPPLNTGPARNNNIPIIPSSHPHGRTNAKTHSVPPCDASIYSEPWDSTQTVDGKRDTTDGGNSGKPFYHTLEGQLVTSATGKEQTPVTKTLISPSTQTPASTRLHDDKDWSHHSPVPAVAKAHPRNDASPSGSQYAEPWSAHNVKQHSTKKPAPFYHTLECSATQSEEITTADPKPAASPGALIPPSANPPATSMSSHDDKDWSHHSPVPTVASSSSIQYAEPHNVKTMQEIAKKPAPFYHTLECSTKQSEETTTVDPKPVTSSGEADSEMQAHSPGRSDVIFDDPAYLPVNSTTTPQH